MISPSELSMFITASYAKADSGLMTPPQRYIVPKRYTLTFATLAPAATQTQQLQIGANADFFLTRMTYMATNAGAAQTYSSAIIPQWRIQITDSGSDEQFYNAPADINSIAGPGWVGADVMAEPYPRLVTGRSTLTLQASSYEAANTYSVDLILHGVLVKTYDA